MTFVTVFVLCAQLAVAQDQKSATATGNTSATAAEKAAQDERVELSRALSEGGNSPQDYIRVLEAHLTKYPSTTRRAEIERTIAKAAVDAKDDKRIIQYGEIVLAREPNDVQLLDRVSRAYLASEDPSVAPKALALAQKYEGALSTLRQQPAPGRFSAAQWSDELDKAGARSLVLQARASGVLGRKPEAIVFAHRSFEIYPTAEGAREQARWLLANGDKAAAIERLAAAFTIEDPRSTEADRARDRRRMGEIYTQLHGSEEGLGDIILHAYDQTSSLMSDRVARLKSRDPNTQAAGILDFTLPGANGNSLSLATLKGKAIVFDFWATWCGPCKAQRPLYDEVAKKFQGKPDVVFLSVNTDEERSLVAPFLKAQKWTNAVYFDGGLSDFLKVNSIPTTLIVDRRGQIASRMNGFIPERFVDLLTERIEETLR